MLDSQQTASPSSATTIRFSAPSLWILTCLVAFAGGYALHVATSAILKPPSERKVLVPVYPASRDPKPLSRIPHFELKDQQGNSVSSSELLQSPYLLLSFGSFT